MKIVIKNQLKKYKINIKLIKKICKFLFEYFNISKYYELYICFCSLNFIKKLNYQYRFKNKPTDVLSFAINDGENVETKMNETKIPKLLGDVFICPEYIKKNMQTVPHSFQHEITYLLIHGFMHLIGYDHLENDYENSKMCKDASKVFNKIINSFVIKNIIRSERNI